MQRAPRQDRAAEAPACCRRGHAGLTGDTLDVTGPNGSDRCSLRNRTGIEGWFDIDPQSRSPTALVAERPKGRRCRTWRPSSGLNDRLKLRSGRQTFGVETVPSPFQYCRLVASCDAPKRGVRGEDALRCAQMTLIAATYPGTRGDGRTRRSHRQDDLASASIFDQLACFARQSI